MNRLSPPGASIQFTAQFLVTAGVRPAVQDFVVRLGSVSGIGEPPEPLRFKRASPRSDQALELHLASELNQTYRIECSDDLLTWKPVPETHPSSPRAARPSGSMTALRKPRPDLEPNRSASIIGDYAFGRTSRHSSSPLAFRT